MRANPQACLDYLKGKVDEYVKQGGRDTMALNVRRDRYNVGYARIPDGESCDFCRMLGSRGFIYHSEETAGGGSMHGTEFDSYHPYCNCQIAVTFDRAVLDYWKHGTHVTRGFGAGEVVSPGRDGSRELRDVDIDDLFDEYVETGKSYPGGSGGVSRSSTGKRFSTDKLSEFMDMIDNAETMDELMEADRIISAAFKRLPRSSAKTNQWESLSRRAIRKREELLANN